MRAFDVAVSASSGTPMTPGRPVHGPDRSIWPSAARGAGAAGFGLPSDVRGIFGVGWLRHWAVAGSATAADATTIATTVSAPLILTSKGGRILSIRPPERAECALSGPATLQSLRRRE